MTHGLYESEIEQIVLDILRDEDGYAIAFGPDISEGEDRERDHTEVVLQGRLRAAIDRLNPDIPAEAREDAARKALRTPSVNLLENNESFHRMLIDGIDVKFSVGGGKARTDKVWLVDFNDPENNEFLAVNQYTVVENHNRKRPDVVLLVNGLPLAVMELKNPVDENADVHAAFQQLQTYKQLIPSLFTFNTLLIASDGWFARVGTLSGEYPRFMEWKTDDGKRIVDTRKEPALAPMLKGLLNKQTLTDLIRHSSCLKNPKP
nr:type I restriction endonuclease subunit R [Desulfobacula sp.]